MFRLGHVQQFQSPPPILSACVEAILIKSLFYVNQVVHSFAASYIGERLLLYSVFPTYTKSLIDVFNRSPQVKK